MKRLGVLLVVALAGGCTPVDVVKPYRELAAQRAEDATATWPMFPVPLEDIYRILATGEGRQVEVQRSTAGLWQPGTGAVAAAGALMSAAQDRLIPMPAYRRLEVDPSADPAFGFGGTDVTLTVETHTAQRLTIRFGGPSPTGGGYYVRRDGDPAVYVVAQQVFDDVRSLLTGTEVVRPDDPRVEKALAESIQNEDPEEVTNPWLGQILEGGSPSAAR